jgi:hypothetical protein
LAVETADRPAQPARRCHLHIALSETAGGLRQITITNLKPVTVRLMESLTCGLPCAFPWFGKVIGLTPVEADAWRQCDVLSGTSSARWCAENALSASLVEVSNTFVVQLSINCLVQSIARTIAGFDACIDAKHVLFQHSRFPSLLSISNIDILFYFGLAFYCT